MLGFIKKLFSAEMYEVDPETTGEASLSVPTIEEPIGGEETVAKKPIVRPISSGRRPTQEPLSLQERRAA